MDISNNDQNNTDFVIDRLVNYTTAAEGSVLPPRQRGDSRVPTASGFQIIQTVSSQAATTFTLSWTDVDLGSTVSIDHYNIYYTVLGSNIKEPIGPFTAHQSPAQITIPATALAAITFYLQTVLKNGMTSDMDGSPTVSGYASPATSSRVELVSVLPTDFTAYPQGAIVILTSDNKIYRSTGSAWTKSVDGADLVAGSVTTGSIAAGAITTTTLAAAAVDATKINIRQLIVAGMTLTANSPTSGNVAWSSCTVYYDGTAYSISAGNTTGGNGFISWTVGAGTFTESATFTPSSTVFLIATNVNGTGDLAWNKVAAGGIVGNHITMPAVLYGTDGALMLTGFTWTSHSPASTSIAWSAGTVTYKGITYSVSAGNADNTHLFIYWYVGTPTTFQTSLTMPSLGVDAFLIAVNNQDESGNLGTVALVGMDLHDTLVDKTYMIPGAIIHYNAAGKFVTSWGRAGTAGSATLRMADGTGTGSLGNGQRVIITGSDGKIQCGTLEINRNNATTDINFQNMTDTTPRLYANKNLQIKENGNTYYIPLYT